MAAETTPERTCLVAIDGSEHADYALDYTVIKEHQAPFNLLENRAYGYIRTCPFTTNSVEVDDGLIMTGFCKYVHKPGDKVVLVYAPEIHNVLNSSASVYQFNREVVTQLLKDEEKRIKEELSSFADKLKDHHIGGRVKSVVCNKPGEGIIEAAEQEGASIIIIGSRGHGQVRRTLLGSVSDYVVHHAHIPVLVCKHPHKHVQHAA